MSSKARIENQRAELRLVMRDGSDYALLRFVNIRGRELVAGHGKLGNSPSFRSSHHQRGQRNLYFAEDRIAVDFGPRLQDSFGAELLDNANTGVPDWTYGRPSPDKGPRQTRVIDKDEFPEGGSIMIWAVEPARLDLLQHVRKLEFLRPGLRGMMEVAFEWIHTETSPIVAILVLRQTEEARERVLDAMRTSGFDPKLGEPSGFLIGGPPPRDWSAPDAN